MQDSTSLIHAIEQRASDVTVVKGQPLAWRRNRKVTLDCDRMVSETEFKALYEIAGNPANGQVFGLTYKDRRFRGIYTFTDNGPKFQLRLLPEKIPELDSLGPPPAFADLLVNHRGLIIVTGATGSGKSTTLAAAIDRINRTRELNIITLEDPIEYLHQHKKCYVSQRQLGRDTQNYAEGIREAMREDPDVLMVGELRDLEAIHAALTLAETGHLVFGTLHTKDAPGSITRIIDADPNPETVSIFSHSFLGVLAQQLLPTKKDGLVAAYELMLRTPALLENIRSRSITAIRNDLKSRAHKDSCSMDASIEKLYRDAKISRETALSYAYDPEKLAKQI